MIVAALNTFVTSQLLFTGHFTDVLLLNNLTYVSNNKICHFENQFHF